jgi:hypothetical protein
LEIVVPRSRSNAAKPHNGRSIRTDREEHGSAVWDRLRGGRSGTLWYYRPLVVAYRKAGANAQLVNALDLVVGEIERFAAAPEA